MKCWTYTRVHLRGQKCIRCLITYVQCDRYWSCKSSYRLRMGVFCLSCFLLFLLLLFSLSSFLYNLIFNWIHVCSIVYEINLYFYIYIYIYYIYRPACSLHSPQSTFTQDWHDVRAIYIYVDCGGYQAYGYASRRSRHGTRITNRVSLLHWVIDILNKDCRRSCSATLTWVPENVKISARPLNSIGN